MDNIKDTVNLIESLNERAKELKCLYSVEECLKDFDSDRGAVFRKVLNVIPPGWQYPDVCEASILFEGNEMKTAPFYERKLREQGLFMESELVTDGRSVGKITVVYTEEVELKNGEVFLPEEQKLLDTIADRISNYILNSKIRKIFFQWDNANKILQKLLDEEKQVLKILKNADQSKISEYIKSPPREISSIAELEKILKPVSKKHWEWRMEMAGRIAEKTDFEKYGVKGMYIFGSTKNADSGPCSDIDLLVHFNGSEGQKAMLLTWFEGWSQCLSEMNYQKTGFETNGLLDVHIITDRDIEEKNSYAMKIGALTDAARPLKIKEDK